MMTNFPSITINVAIYNEEKRIAALLRSIKHQDYPADLIETIVVDGRSTDRSREVCASFGVRIVDNPDRTAPAGRKLGCELASGQLHIYMDADMEWAHPRCLQQLVKPHLEVDSLIGSFPRFALDRSDPPLNRCLSTHPLQQDPLFRVLSTQIDDTVIEKREPFTLCRFAPGQVPVVGVVLYRTEMLKEMLRAWGPNWEWNDIDFALECAERGDDLFAFVPEAQLFHRSYLRPRVYLSKKRRDVRASYLRTLDNRRASYIDWSARADVLRLVGWILYVNLVVPGFLRACLKAMRYRDPAMLYELFLETVGTDYVLWQFIRDPIGRQLLKRALQSAVAGDSKTLASRYE